LSTVQRRLLWVAVGFAFGVGAALLSALSDVRAINCEPAIPGLQPIPTSRWLIDSLRRPLTMGFGLAPFVWHFGLAAVMPGALGRGFVVMALIWAACVIGPLLFPDWWHACSDDGSGAFLWLAGCAILALPVFVVTRLLSRMIFDKDRA
jgi:hypothetical protein